MKRTFLVTGYPRTRGTWLAAFLSSGDTLCLHEPILMFNRHFPPMADYIAGLPYRNVGISDSCIPSMSSLFALVYAESPVLVVERDKAGGACLNVGCIPSKALINAAKLYEKIQHGADLGILTDNPRVDMAKQDRTPVPAFPTLRMGLPMFDPPANWTSLMPAASIMRPLSMA